MAAFPAVRVPCPACGESISLPVEARNGDRTEDGALVVNLTVPEGAASTAVADHLAGKCDPTTYPPLTPKESPCSPSSRPPSPTSSARARPKSTP